MSATDVTKESQSPGRRLAAMVIQTLGSMKLAVALLVLLGC